MKKLFTATLAVLLLCLAGTSAAYAQDEEKKKKKKVTIVVECGSQGVVDTDWTLEFDLYKDGKKVNKKPLKVTIANGTGSGPAAQRMAVAINMSAGETAATAGETTHPDHTPPKSSSGKLKAEDLTMEDGYEVKNIKKKKKGSSKGHVKVKKWECEVKEKKDDKEPDSGGKALAVGPAVTALLPLPSPGPAIPDARFELLEANTPFLGVAISITGTDPSGAVIDVSIDVPLDTSIGLSAIVGLIGSWANAVGFTTTYPTNTSVVLDFAGSPITVDFWSFTVYPYDWGSSLGEESVAFNAD